MRILIIGAGPVGLSTALELAHHGVIPRVVEKQNGPSEFSRAVGLLPVTRLNLRHEGVGEAILREGVPWRKFQVHRGDKTLLDLDLSGKVKPEEALIGLPQDRTEGLIRDGITRLGATVEYGVEVTALETTDECATVTFADGSQETCDWVIACDGKHSTAREQLGIEYVGIDLPEIWSIADIDMGEDFDPEQPRFWIQGKDGAFATVLPIERRRARALSSTDDALATIPADLGVVNVRRSGTFTISVRQAVTYRKGRVLLAGDSAHCHSPVGGRGMNLGIDDAVAAARAILEDTTEFYSDARHPVGARILKTTESARRKMMSESAMTEALIKVGLLAVQNITAIQGGLIRKLTGL